jgi:type IV pilus assembly protein PilM
VNPAMLENLAAWLSDPPPQLIFEISEAGVSLARLAPKTRMPETMLFSPMAEGAIEASPLRENVRNAEEFHRALQELLAQIGNGKRKRDAAVLLPDNCARITVLDFENLPGDAGERLALLRWRLKKAVPFDADTASIAYQVQRSAGAEKAISVLVAVSPSEVVGQYEAAIRRLGLVPGYVSVSVAAALNLVVEQGVTMLAKLSGRNLSLVVMDQGRVRLVRSLEAGSGVQGLSEEQLQELAADLYPTFVYVADNFGAPVSKLILAGFGAAFAAAQEVFRRELGCEAQALTGPQGVVEAHNAGIWGFLSGS